MLLSSLYNKPIIDNYSAQHLGTINQIHINNQKIDYFLTSRNVKIKVSNICKINDAIMYKAEDRYYPDFKFYSIANQMITDEKGKIYGNLIDLMVTKTFEVRKIMSVTKNLCNVDIISMSQDSLVFKRKPKAKKVVTVQPAPAADPNIITTISNYGFLIGRIIQKNIMANGNIILPSGKKITKQDIDIAQKHGKIIDITIYSKFYNIENL